MKRPIADEVAEQWAIGAVMAGGRDAFERASILAAEDFWSRANGEIWRAIGRVIARGEEPDYATMTAEVPGHRDTIEAVLRMMDEHPFADAVESYARRVRGKAVIRRIQRALWDAVAAGEKAETPDAYARDAEQALLTAAADAAPESLLVPIRDVAIRRLEEIHDFHRHGKSPAISTGFPSLDVMLGGGFRRKRLIVLGARPRMGKSAFASCLTMNVSRGGHRVAVFSMEMTSEDWLERMIASESRVSLSDVESPAHFGDIARANETICRLPIFITDRPALSIGELKAECRRLKSTEGLDLVVVDYMTLARADRRTENDQQEASQISQGLLSLAKDLDTTVLTLAQLNRGCDNREDKRPILRDLRGSGQIEQDAHVVAFLYRDAVYETTASPYEAELAIRKNRGGMETPLEQPLIFRWRGQLCRFEELTDNGGEFDDG